MSITSSVGWLCEPAGFLHHRNGSPLSLSLSLSVCLSVCLSLSRCSCYQPVVVVVTCDWLPRIACHWSLQVAVCSDVGIRLTRGFHPMQRTQRTRERTQEKYATNVADVVDGTAVLIIHNPFRYSVVCFCNLNEHKQITINLTEKNQKFRGDPPNHASNERDETIHPGSLSKRVKYTFVTCV